MGRNGASIIGGGRAPVKPVTRRIYKHLCGLALLAGAATLAAATARAGPWVQARGGYFAKFNASYLYTRTEFDAHGNEVPLLHSNPLVRDAAYREVVLASYIEYGVRERVTVLGSLPFKIATSARTEISQDANVERKVDVTNGGWSDLFLGVRYALVRGSRPVAIEAGAKLPLGYASMPDNGGPALGTGKPDAEAALLAGFGAAHVYGSVRAAYRVMGGSLDDLAGFSAELGGSHRRLFAQAVLEGWYTTGDIVPLDVSSTMMVANQDLLKLIATAGMKTGTHTAVALEVYHVLDGRNAPTGTTVAAAIAFKTP